MNADLSTPPLTELDYTLSATEHAQAYNLACAQLLQQVQGRSSRLTRLQRMALAALLGFVLALVASYWLRGTALLTAAIGVGLALGAIDIWVRLRRRQRHMQSLWRERLGDQLTVRVSDAGLNVVSVLGETAFRWDAVRHAQIVSPFVLIQLPGASLLPIPLRAFSDQAQAASFVNEINARAQSNARAQGTPSAAPTEAAHTQASDRPWSPKPTPLSFLRTLVRNLRAGVHLTLLRSNAVATLHPSVGQFFALLLVASLVGFLAEFAQVGPEGQFEWIGLRSTLVALMVCVATAWVAVVWTDTAVESSLHTFLRLAVGLAALWAVFEVLSRLREADMHWRWVSGWLRTSAPPQWAAWWTWGAYWAVWLWFVLAAGLTAAHALQTHRARKLGAGLSVALVTTFTTMTVGDSQPLWSPRFDAQAAEAQQTKWQSATTEAVIYRQPQLLQEALDAVQPGQPGRTELFYVGLAGAGYQDVFINEVESVQKLLHERFGAQGHGVLLVNAARSPLTHPFASVTALEKTLHTLAQRMNVEEDVLFLFMTSHGSRKHEFEIDLWPYRFDPITPQRLRELLDASGIGHRVIVVSACYSGGFVPALADADTLVITAARADRTSFGCADGNAWTHFGEAYFAQALTQTTSFEEAFHRATALITERERNEKHTPSEPQMQVGERIRERLRLVATTSPTPKVEAP